MRDKNLKNGPQAAPEAYEHQDLRPAGILYFLLTLGLVVVIALVGLRGLYSFLDTAGESLAAAGESADHQHSRRYAACRSGISADGVSQSEAGRRRTRSAEQHPERKTKRFTATDGSTKKPERSAFRSTAPWIYWSSEGCRFDLKELLNRIQRATSCAEVRLKRQSRRVKRSELYECKIDFRRARLLIARDAGGPCMRAR